VSSIWYGRKYSEFVKNEKKYKNLIESKSFIIKNILSLLGKGTGNGQEIRDEILKIMHRNKMSKSPEKKFLWAMASKIA